jgi:hypothetical protein
MLATAVAGQMKWLSLHQGLAQAFTGWEPRSELRRLAALPSMLKD